MTRTLFLAPPAFPGFDGGAGSRYQARREITSYWYPTWLAQPAALVPGSRLLDATPHGLGVPEVLEVAKQYDLVILHTSTPSFANDARCAEAIKAANPDARIAMIGAHPAVLPAETLESAPAVDFVCRAEFDHTCRELAEGQPPSTILGLSWRSANGVVHHNDDRPPVLDWDTMPSVLPVYRRDLDVAKYSIGYLLHPYVSFYTGRGCTAKCTFCLWPQTIGGHVYRAKTPRVVIEEMEIGKSLFPEVREWMFDDDTFTNDRERAVRIAEGMSRLKLTWSCNARAHVDFDTLAALKRGGLRLLLVGFESGNQEILNRIRKGIRLDMARAFMRDCHRLGIKVHGTFVLGLPIETQETIEQTIRFAAELDPHTIQVSIAAPYPGTELYRQAVTNGWIEQTDMLSATGIQAATMRYIHLSPDQIEDAVERMYRRFYFRLRPMLRMVREMATERGMFLRRLREGAEFMRYLTERRAPRAGEPHT